MFVNYLLYALTEKQNKKKKSKACIWRVFIWKEINYPESYSVLFICFVLCF